MRVPPFALNAPAVEREHDANVDASETLIDHEMSLPSGRASKRVRSRGLPRNRGMDRKCGIMTVAIRRLLVAGGAGERPAKSYLTSPVCVLSECPPLWRAFAGLASKCSKNVYRDLPDVPEMARVRLQWLCQQCGSVRIGSVVDVSRCDSLSDGIELIHPMREGRSPQQIGRKGLSNHRWMVGGKLCPCSINGG